jgi:glycerate kinase
MASIAAHVQGSDMRVLAAPDKFKGSATAAEVAAAITAAALARGHTCHELPLADGGEGTLEAFGGANRHSPVSGPDGSNVRAGWRLDGDVAVIEAARASGLQLAGGREANNAVAATTRGTGELIERAVTDGARRVIVGVGGVASTDGGAGAIEVLAPYAPFGTAGATELLVACDVQTLFVDAAPVFAAQKGASEDQVAELRERLERLQARYRETYGIDVASLPGSGAAGGLAGGLAAIGGRLVGGFDVIANQLGLDRALSDSDLVVSGEGLLDRESFAGKVVGGVIARARAQGIRCAIIVGDYQASAGAGVPTISLLRRFGARRAWSQTTACIGDAMLELLASIAAET